MTFTFVIYLTFNFVIYVTFNFVIYVTFNFVSTPTPHAAACDLYVQVTILATPAGPPEFCS